MAGLLNFRRNLIRTTFISLALAGSLVSAYAEIRLAAPITIYEPEDGHYDTALTGVEVASDRANRIMAMWMTNGTFGHHSVTIKTAYSADAGATWGAPVVVDIPGAGNAPHDMELAYAGGDKWIALFSYKGEANQADYYASQSIDNGATWSAPALIESNTNGGGDRLDVDYDGAGTIICTIRADLLRSTDGGANWEFLDVSILPPGYEGGEGTSSIAYGGGGKWYHAMYRVFAMKSRDLVLNVSTDNGATWSVSEEFRYLQMSQLALGLTGVAADGDRAVVTIGRSGLNWVVTEDGGATWSDYSTPGMPEHLPAATAVKGDQIVSLVNQPPGVALVSSDGGATRTIIWTAFPVDGARDLLWSGNELITVHRSNNTAIYESKMQVLRSSDYGETWTPGPDITTEYHRPYAGFRNLDPTIGVNPDTGRIVAVWRATSNLDEEGFLYSLSDDNGHTWSGAQVLSMQIPSTVSYPVRAPELTYAGNNNWVLLSTDSITESTAISRSADDGATWSEPFVYQTGSNRYTILASNNAGTLLGRGNTSSEVEQAYVTYYFRSDDFGATFGITGGNDFGLAIASLGGNTWIKIDDGQAWLSTDNAHTWNAHGSLPGFGDLHQLKLSVSPNYSTILVAVVSINESSESEFRVYRSQDQGLSWTVTETMPMDSPYKTTDINLKHWHDDTWVISANVNIQFGKSWSYSDDNGQTWSTFRAGSTPSMASSNGSLMSIDRTPWPIAEPQTNSITVTHFEEYTPTSAADWQLYH